MNDDPISFEAWFAARLAPGEREEAREAFLAGVAWGRSAQLDEVVERMQGAQAHEAWRRREVIAGRIPR